MTTKNRLVPAGERLQGERRGAAATITDTETPDLSDQAKRNLWMHFSRMGSYEDHEVPGDRARRGRVRLGPARQALPRRPGRAVHLAARPRPHRAGRGRRQAGRDARLLPAVDLRPPPRHRAGRAGGELHARRPQPGLLHHRRLRGGRVGLEAGPPVLPHDRAAAADEGDQPLHRLPRHVDGRALHHRHPRAAHALRAARARCDQGAQHELLPGRGVRRRRGRVRPLGRRRDRTGHRAGGLRHGGRRVPRAGAERRRLLPAAARATSSGCARSATATACCSSPTR